MKNPLVNISVEASFTSTLGLQVLWSASKVDLPSLAVKN